MKRSVKAYRPTGIDLGEGPDMAAHIDALIEIAGPLPNRQFEIQQPQGPDEPWATLPLQVSARDYLQHHLRRAAQTFGWEMQQGNKPTPAQLAADFGAIEKAAHRLLHALQVTDAGDFERMPHSLRFGGLSAQAHSQAMRGKAAVAELHNGDILLRHVVEGVRDLHRWSKAARQREREAHARRLPAPKFEGNPALRDFVGNVVVNGWWATWGREVRDSPRMRNFIIAAAKIIGHDLSEDAARGQLRANFADTFAFRRRAKLGQTNE